MNFYKLWETINEGKGHVGIGGIQSWSAGELFPYQIKIIGSGPGKIQAYSPDNKVVAEEPFQSLDIDFKDAHQRVELAVRKMLNK